MFERVEILKGNFGEDDPSVNFCVLIHRITAELRTSTAPYLRDFSNFGAGFLNFLNLAHVVGWSLQSAL